MRRLLATLASATPIALIPTATHAQALTQATGLFNLFVGFMLVASLVTYIASLLVWLARLGTWPSFRGVAINMGEWAVIILFTLVMVLTVVQFFRDHPRAASATTGTVVFIIVLGAVLYLALFKKEEEKKK